MFQLPRTFIPNYVKALKLPTVPLSQSKADVAFYKSSLRHSTMPINGSFELIFESYPVKSVNISGKDSVLAPDEDNCELKQLGWESAYFDFHLTDTQNGHLLFEIPATHDLWRVIEYSTGWQNKSYNGLPTIWRITKFDMPNDRHIKQTVDFSVVIEEELRSNRWV
jgi:hypothetical protein